MTIANILGIFGIIALFGWMWTRTKFKDDRYMVWGILCDILLAASNTIAAIVQLLAGRWTWGISAIFAVWMLWELWRDWHNWKNRKKVAKALGGKAKAIRDKMVKRVRELGPSPVRVPS